MASAWSRLMILANPVRSAPAASMNGFPVIAIAAMSVAGQRGIQGSVQLAETTCAQGIRSSVTTAVVKRDQHRSSRCMGQRDVPAQRPGDDLTLASRRGLSDQLVELVGPHAAASSSAEKCGILPDHRAAHAETDAHGGEPIADLRMLPERPRQMNHQAYARSWRADGRGRSRRRTD